MRLWVAVCLFASLVSCSVVKEKKSSRVRAPSTIDDSFYLASPENGGKKTLAIKKSALEKEFLLQGSMIRQVVVPMLGGLKSRIVIFKHFGNALYMLEATKGHQVTPELPQHLVLAKFPITKTEGDLIYFDFNEGMSKIFVESDWFGSDFSGGFYSTQTWDSLPIETSYLEDVAMDEDNNLVIRQMAQVVETALSLHVKVPVEVKYYLKPYKENPGFSPTVTENFDRMGFFEVAPQLQSGSGETLVYASKFDTRKPIKFAVSANTPEDYKQAVKDGVLYWNKVFGRDVMQVVDAPKGVTAPDFRHNIIQWVDWQDAGFAYADAQMDPRTGEILHAQVFMTSVFAISSKAQARSLLQKLSVKLRKAKTEEKSKSLSLSGFQKDLLCRFDPSQSLALSLVELLANDNSADDAAILRVSQDYVREVVAHEVGHTLGLRHNFAGSLASNLTAQNKEAVFNQYLQTGDIPQGLVTTSSVMEYQRFEEATMSGRMIATKSEAGFSYDTKAIATLYNGETFDSSDIPFYCTDSHLAFGSYWDCNVFDAGLAPLEFQLFRESSLKKNLPYFLVESFIAAKTTKKRGGLNALGEAVFSPSAVAMSMLSPKNQLLRLLKDDFQLLSVRRTFPYINEMNENEVIEKEHEELVKQVALAGGFEKIFTGDFTKEMLGAFATFSSLLDKAPYSEGVGPNGVSFQFSDQEKAFMRQKTMTFFMHLIANYRHFELETLNQVGALNSSDFSPVFEKLLVQKMTPFILGAGENFKDVLILADGTRQDVELPSFDFGADTRVKAAEQFTKKSSSDPIWGRSSRKALHAALKDKLDKALGIDFAKLDLDAQSEKIAVWGMGNKKVLTALAVQKL